MTGDEVLKLSVPKREWLLRCYDSHGELGIYSIGVERGALTIAMQCRHDFALELDGSLILEFRDALNEAITVVEADLRRNKYMSVLDQSRGHSAFA